LEKKKKKKYISDFIANEKSDLRLRAFYYAVILLGINLLILAAFEILRRLFYYVFLGKLNPPLGK